MSRYFHARISDGLHSRGDGLVHVVHSKGIHMGRLLFDQIVYLKHVIVIDTDDAPTCLGCLGSGETPEDVKR